MNSPAIALPRRVQCFIRTALGRSRAVRRNVSIGVVLSVVVSVVCCAEPAPVAVSRPCDLATHRALDFWIGDWDVFEINGSEPVARARIEPILNGCVLHETYMAAEGHSGESFSIYDASRGVWHQTWTTNSGDLLVIEGTFRAGVLEMSGTDQAPTGQSRLVRGSWKAIPGGVRETAFRSLNAGKTWDSWFDLEFRPHSPERQSGGPREGQ